MELKNAVIGQVVQIKYIHYKPTECSLRTAYEYGVNTEEHEGVIVSHPDADGDVRVQFGDWFEHAYCPHRDYLHVHHSKLRKVK